MGIQTKTRVLVVEGEAGLGQAIELMLGEHDFELAGTATAGDDVLALVGTVQPDLVVVDVDFGQGRDGIETARLIRQRSDVPVLLVGSAWDEETISRAAGSGATGYVVSPLRSSDLLSAATLASQRSTEAPSDHSAEINELYRMFEAVDDLASRREGSAEALTPREAQVVRALLTYHNLALVAEELQISLHTVRNHLKAVFRKLRVHSQDELVRTLLQRSSTPAH